MNLLQIISDNEICISWYPKVLYLTIPNNHVSITHKNVTIKRKGKTKQECLVEGLEELGFEVN